MNVAIGTTRGAAALRAAIQGVMVGASLGGCIMLPPLPFASQQEMPALSPYIPADVMSGTAQLLVLTHRKSDNRVNLFSRRFEHTSAVDGRLLKGDEFAAFVGGLKIFRERGIHLIGAAGCIQLGAPCRGFAERQVNARESLERLCVMAADGREITLRTVRRGSDTLFEAVQERLHAARREAIVLALRAPGEQAFARIDPPCSLDDKADWPAGVRSLAIEFLTRLPDSQPVPADPRIGSLMRRTVPARSDGAALLLATGAWRDQEAANPPLFLNPADVRAFRDLAPTAGSGDAVAAMFNEHRLLYMSGARSLQSLAIRHICVIGADGDIRYWTAGKGWRSLVDRTSLEQRQGAALRVLRGERGALDGDCMPARPRDWSDQEFQTVVTFISDLMPPAERPD